MLPHAPSASSTRNSLPPLALAALLGAGVALFDTLVQVIQAQGFVHAHTMLIPPLLARWVLPMVAFGVAYWYAAVAHWIGAGADGGRQGGKVLARVFLVLLVAMALETATLPMLVELESGGSTLIRVMLDGVFAMSILVRGLLRRPGTAVS